VVVTAGHGWHPGVVGLVAARLKEHYGRPAFAIALEPGGYRHRVGPLDPGRRSWRGGAPCGCGRLLLKGGGHAMAAGITISPDKLAPFRAYLEEALHGAVEVARREDSLLIDGAVTAGAPMWRC